MNDDRRIDVEIERKVVTPATPRSWSAMLLSAAYAFGAHF